MASLLVCGALPCALSRGKTPGPPPHYTRTAQPATSQLPAPPKPRVEAPSGLWAGRRPRDAAPLIAAARRVYVPNRVLAVATEGPDLAAQQRLVPLLEQKRAMGGRTTAYVCRGTACDLPTSDPKELVRQLSRADPLPP